MYRWPENNSCCCFTSPRANKWNSGFREITQNGAAWNSWSVELWIWIKTRLIRLNGIESEQDGVSHHALGEWVKVDTPKCAVTTRNGQWIAEGFIGIDKSSAVMRAGLHIQFRRQGTRRGLEVDHHIQITSWILHCSMAVHGIQQRYCAEVGPCFIIIVRGMHTGHALKARTGQEWLINKRGNRRGRPCKNHVASILSPIKNCNRR